MGSTCQSNSGDAPLESILLTDELRRRPSRAPDYETESRALVGLANALSESPGTVLQRLAETILEVCRAGSAGISLLTKDDGGKRFYWPAIAGRWKPHIGGGTPRDFGPCGDVLDCNGTLLFGPVEKRYTYFQPVVPRVQEALLVPFYLRSKAVGTIWAVAHDEHKFDEEDERIMKSLGQFASSAYQTVETLEALTARTAEAIETERATALLASIIDSSDDAIVSKNLDGTITSWNRSAERLFGYMPEEAVGKHITLIVPTDRRDEEVTILERLKRGERIDHFETIRRRKDGRLLDISVTISPIRDRKGKIIGASKVARDITDRKRAEQALRDSEDQLRILTQQLETKVYLRTQELEERNARVLHQTEELRELSSRLLRTQDDERRRLARELHDSAGQIITALSLNLAYIGQGVTQEDGLSKTVRESSELVQELNKEIRTLSYLLHPPLLDEKGLPGAIRWYLQGMTERSGLTFDVAIPENFGRLSDEIELAVFRIVQECVTNVHRHSGSKTAAIRLMRDAQNVSLEIQDVGNGMSPEKLARNSRHVGVGITGMRERVRHLKGVVNIQSDTKGTKVSVTLPIPAAASSSVNQAASRSKS
jgi:PAS domain S-box-containing protein